MLNFDMSGKLIEPSRLKKTWGGQIDAWSGVPSEVLIPTTGDYAGVTVENYGPDSRLGKTIKRTTSGQAAVKPQYSSFWRDEHKAHKLRAFFVGGCGSNETFAGAQTQRTFQFGFFESNGDYAVYFEFVPVTAENRVVVNDNGTITTYPVNFQAGRSDDRMPLTVWLSRNGTTDNLTFTIANEEQIQSIVEIGEFAGIRNKYIAGEARWDWQYGSGRFEPTISLFETSIYFMF